ncbi:hypothetical protein Acr_08g0014120 [Actinidia rufa]|uniref:BRISC and BRCA1-A complex member 2 n=1 Tax=Actinidia rufa TaxID=165716 RepID=A0A7J0F3M8_9ERIC|nr:hypothetical protein Acr_08g0014120 [Actinidia rufa]
MAINTVPPLIAAQLNYLLSNSPLPINVEQKWSGSKHHGLLDRFTLVIPFCLDYIRWDVIYNALYPLAAPDIIFGPEDQSFRPYHMAGGEGDLKSPKKSLSDWNCKDPTRLLSLILELRELYMTYQRKRVGEVDDERLKFELSTIVPREGIEMYMRSGIEKVLLTGTSLRLSNYYYELTEEVKFVVPLLGVDINKMVTGCPWRHQQKIFLEVIFPVDRKYRHAPSTPRLKLAASPELKALFSIGDFRLPPWLDDMCMAEYLPILEGLLQSQAPYPERSYFGLKIVDAVSSIDVRRKFIVALAPLFGRPVEADPNSSISDVLWGVHIFDLPLSSGLLPLLETTTTSFSEGCSALTPSNSSGLRPSIACNHAIQSTWPPHELPSTSFLQPSPTNIYYTRHFSFSSCCGHARPPRVRKLYLADTEFTIGSAPWQILSARLNKAEEGMAPLA